MRVKRPSSVIRHLFASIAVVVAFIAFSPVSIAATLRGNLRDDLPNIDPAAFNGPIGHRLLSLVYQGFTSISQDGQLVPALAVRWETPDHGRTWRFFLRPGVRFHSGRPLSASDVRHSLESLLRAKRPSISAQFLDKLKGREDFQHGRSPRLAGVVEIDRLTVELRFDEAVAAFPYYPFFIVDGGAEAAWGPGWHNAHSGGAGPFKLKEWRRGRDLTLTVNHDYWGPKPAVEELSFIVAPGIDAALAMFDAGALDFVAAVEPAHRLIATDPRRLAALQAVERRQARFLAMNADVYPPFADPRVRAAVSLVIDRQAVVDGVFGGLATAPRGFGVSAFPETGGAPTEPDAGLDHRHDPAAARELLAQAGYPGGAGLPPLEFAVVDFLRDEGAYYADTLIKELGMPATMKVMERTAMISAANAGRLGLFLGGWTADFPDPLTYLDPIWRSRSPYNQARWRDAAYDALMDEAQRTPDRAARTALYRQAERRLAEGAAAAMLPTPHNMLLRNAKAEKLVAITPFGHLAFTPRDGAAGQ